jgi:hypothetical protein
LKESVDPSSFKLNDYWADLCRLLIVFQKGKVAKQDKDNVATELAELKSSMVSNVYDMFIDAKLDALRN